MSPGSSSRTLLLALAASGLVLALGTGCATTPEHLGSVVPDLSIEASDRHSTLAKHLEQADRTPIAIAAGMVGLRNPGPPIRVVLAPESSEVARSAPAWVAGFAMTPIDTVVLFPDRTTSYPDNSLIDLLRHEVAHVLIYRAAGGAEVPRWFAEGVATVAGSGWGLADRSRATLGALRGHEPSLAEVAEAFAGGTASVRYAYAVSEAFVRYLLKRESPAVVAQVLAHVASGHSFDDAFARSTGSSLAEVERAFWRRHNFLYRWIPVLASSLTLWTAITLLALVAARRRRTKTRELYRRWEAEEALAESVAAEASNDPEREGPVH